MSDSRPGRTEPDRASASRSGAQGLALGATYVYWANRSSSQSTTRPCSGSTTTPARSGRSTSRQSHRRIRRTQIARGAEETPHALRKQSQPRFAKPACRCIPRARCTSTSCMSLGTWCTKCEHGTHAVHTHRVQTRLDTCALRRREERVAQRVWMLPPSHLPGPLPGRKFFRWQLDTIQRFSRVRPHWLRWHSF